MWTVLLTLTNRRQPRRHHVLLVPQDQSLSLEPIHVKRVPRTPTGVKVWRVVSHVLKDPYLSLELESARAMHVQNI